MFFYFFICWIHNKFVLFFIALYRYDCSSELQNRSSVYCSSTTRKKGHKDPDMRHDDCSKRIDDKRTRCAQSNTRSRLERLKGCWLRFLLLHKIGFYPQIYGCEGFHQMANDDRLADRHNMEAQGVEERCAKFDGLRQSTERQLSSCSRCWGRAKWKNGAGRERTAWTKGHRTSFILRYVRRVHKYSVQRTFNACVVPSVCDGRKFW